MTREAEINLFSPLLEGRPDLKMMERLSPIANYRQAAEISAQAGQIQAMAKRLGQTHEKQAVSEIVGEFPDVMGTLKQMEKRLREASAELLGLVNREFSADRERNAPPVIARAEAYFWRNRIIGDLFSASTSYRLAAELLSLAVKALGIVSPAAESPENSLLLNQAATLLVDAAKQMGTAGTELSEHVVHWQNMERALEVIG